MIIYFFTLISYFILQIAVNNEIAVSIVHETQVLIISSQSSTNIDAYTQSWLQCMHVCIISMSMFLYCSLLLPFLGRKEDSSLDISCSVELLNREKDFT